MEEELTAIEEVCDKVESLRRLECVMELDDKRMRDQLHNVSLNLRILLLVVPNHEIFIESLHRVDLSVIFFLSHIDFAKGASSDHLEQLEVIHCNFFADHV